MPEITRKTQQDASSLEKLAAKMQFGIQDPLYRNSQEFSTDARLHSELLGSFCKDFEDSLPAGLGEPMVEDIPEQEFKRLLYQMPIFIKQINTNSQNISAILLQLRENSIEMKSSNQRLAQFEKTITKYIESQTNVNSEMSKRLVGLENWKFYLFGAAAVAVILFEVWKVFLSD